MQDFQKFITNLIYLLSLLIFAFIAICELPASVHSLMDFDIGLQMVDPTLRKDSNKLRRVKIKLMFEWLAKQEDLNEVIGKLQRYYKSDKEIMSQVRWCVDFFQNLPESSECQSVLSGK